MYDGILTCPTQPCSHHPSTQIIASSLEIGILVEGLQRERDAVTLFLSELGSDTRGNLRGPFINTDEAISRLQVWPQMKADIDVNSTSVR